MLLQSQYNPAKAGSDKGPVVCIQTAVIGPEGLLSVCVCLYVCEFSVQERDLDAERPRFIRFALGISQRYVGGSRGIL